MRLRDLFSDDAVIETLRAARIPVAPVLTLEQAMNHPHLRERRTVRKVHDRLIGDFEVPGFPLRFSAFPDLLDLEAPLLGEHTKEVFGSWLGLSERDVAGLKDEGVI